MSSISQSIRNDGVHFQLLSIFEANTLSCGRNWSIEMRVSEDGNIAKPSNSLQPIATIYGKHLIFYMNLKAK
jgi:hypothetical protein